MEKYGQLFESVFKEKLTDAAVVSHLEKIAAEHPYFSIAQFYLLLQSPKNTPAYRAQAKKTAVLFNNNYWLNFQLLEAGAGKLQNSATEETLTTAPVETAGAADFIEAKPFEGKQEESLLQTEAETDLADNGGELTAAETEADGTAVHPPEMLGNEPPDLSTTIPEQTEADEHTLTVVAQEEPENVPAIAAFNPNEIPDGNPQVESTPSLTEETVPALMEESIINEPAVPVEAITVALGQLTTVDKEPGNIPLVDSNEIQDIHPTEEPTPIIKTEPAAPEESTSEGTAQESTIDMVPENEPVTDFNEIPHRHLPMEPSSIVTEDTSAALVEESITNETAATVESPTEDAAVENHPMETTAVMAPTAGEKPDEVTTAETPPLAIDEPVTEETDKTIVTVPAASLPEKAANELLFEPLHTSDYFASVGIKLSEEEKTADKLGKQLKSFTDWLKTMKKIPAVQASKASQPLETTPTVADNSIQQLAEQSNQGNEVLTEAMAAVLLQQGRRDKAIEILKKLSLLDPAKSAYFAAKINQIKEN